MGESNPPPRRFRSPKGVYTPFGAHPNEDSLLPSLKRRGHVSFPYNPSEVVAALYYKYFNYYLK